MSLLQERIFIRALHLVLSIPIIGFIYGPVAHIAPAATFTRFVAVPLVVISGLWLWQKPRILRWLRWRKAIRYYTAQAALACRYRRSRLGTPNGATISRLSRFAFR